MENGVLTVVSVLANVILLYLLLLAYSGRQYFKGIRDEKEEKFFTEGPAVRPSFRRYVLKRYDDVSGVSGTGVVCEVAEFSDGHAAVHWIGSRYPWTTPCPEGLNAIEDIHGHSGKTRLVPLD